MAKFHRQNKKKVDPRYFLHEGVDLEEGLDSKMFYGSGGIRQSAELDILSYFPQPNKEDLKGLLQRHLDGPSPLIWQLRDFLVHDSADKHTSGRDYKQFRKSPVPDDVAQDLSAKIGLDYERIKQIGGDDKSWPLPGIDLTNYMVYWMVANGTLRRIGRDKVSLTPKGAKRYHELMQTEKSHNPDARQGGKSTSWSYDPSSPRKSGKSFDVSRWK